MQKKGVLGALFTGWCGDKHISQHCTPLWLKAHLEVKMWQNFCPRSTFRRSDVATLHAAVAKSTSGSENGEKKLWSSDVATLHAAVAKSRFGSENVKKTGVGTLFEVRMSQHAAVAKSTCGSELESWEHFLKFGCRNIAHILEVKMLKNCSPRNTFWSSDVATLHTAVAKSTWKWKC